MQDEPETVQPLQPESLRLGPYRIERELGTGGMGSVYRAEVVEETTGLDDQPVRVGETVALKVFHPHLVGTDDFAGRFRREARAGASIRHANVVHTFDAGTAPFRGRETAYLAMEFVEGQTLRDLMNELGQMSEELAVDVARQVCAGLAAVHAAGITHRDVKPENVVLTDEHAVKLMDLGVAKVRDASIRLSLTGQFLGSIHYASPEQFRDTANVDGRTDIYAAGVLLYEMLTGGNPFHHQDLQVVLRRTLTERPPRASTQRPDVSPWLDELVHELIAKDAAERPATADVVLEALQHGTESEWWKRHGRRASEAAGRRSLRRLPVQRETPVVGREPELRELRAAFDEAQSDGTRIVFVEGEAGVGKTRLADEFVASLAQDGVACATTFGICAEAGATGPFAGVAEALDRALGEDVEARLRDLLPPATPVQEFAALIRREPATRPLPDEQVVALFSAALHRLASRTPLVVVLEDVHLADEREFGLLTALARSDDPAPLLVIANHRPLEEGSPTSALARGVRGPRVKHVKLGRLGPRAVAELLRAALRSERLVQELGFRLIEKTEGNPYFILEVLRTLKDEHVLMRRGESWTMSGSRITISVPDSVRELLSDTLARLPDEDRELLDVASVIGMEFEPDVLAAVTGEKRISLLRRLSRLERRHRLIRSEGRLCRFDHQQLQETLYGELMAGLREEYHALVGEELERRRPDGGTGAVDGPTALQLTRHFVRGCRLEPALPYVRTAVHYARSTYATETGAELAAEFIALDDATGNTAGAELRTEVLLALAEFLGHEGRRDEETEVLDRVDELLDEDAEPAMLRRAFHHRLSLHLQAGDFVPAEKICRDALRRAIRRKDRDEATAALANLAGALRCEGRFDEAVNALRRALTWVLPDAVDVRRLLLLTSLGQVQFHRGHTASAQRLFLQARQMGTSFGVDEADSVRKLTPGADDEIRRQFTGLAQALGRYAESRIDAERTLLLADDLPAPVQEAAVLLALGYLAGNLDALGAGRAALDAALRKSRAVGERRFEAAALQALGENAVAAGDVVRAREHFREALEIRRGIGHRPGVCESLLALGQIAALEGDVEGARPYLEEARDLAPALELPGIAALAGATAALLHAREGRHDSARADLEEAREALSGSGPLSISSRAEGLYFAAQAARLLGDEDGYSSYMWQAYELVQSIADRLKPEERQAYLTQTTPNREIVAAVADL